MVSRAPSLISEDDQRVLNEADRLWATVPTVATPTFKIDSSLQLMLPYKRTLVTTQARLLGLRPERFLMCELPSHEGVSLGTTGASCTVRYLAHGKVVGFVASVLKAQFSPEPLLFLSYPSAVKELTLRRQERVRINLDAVARLPDRSERFNGVVRDLSATGCGFATAVAPGVAVGSELMLFIRLPGEEKLNRVKAVVRAIRPRRRSPGAILGLSFTFEAEDAVLKADIERLVAARSGIGTGDLIV